MDTGEIDQVPVLSLWHPTVYMSVIKLNQLQKIFLELWRKISIFYFSFNIFAKIFILEIYFYFIFDSRFYLEERAKKASPFEKPGFFNLFNKIKYFATKNSISLETETLKMKSREKNVVARTIHGAGVVCPFNKKTQVGYRKLSVAESE